MSYSQFEAGVSGRLCICLDINLIVGGWEVEDQGAAAGLAGTLAVVVDVVSRVRSRPGAGWQAEAAREAEA